MFLVNSCMGSFAAAPSHYLLIDCDLESAFFSISIGCLVKKLQITRTSSSFLKENWQATVIDTVTGQTLSRSYGRCIAEFLKKGSLVHLGLLDLSTCVGLRYGRLCL